MTKPTVRALVVEPDEDYAALMAQLLRHMGADVELVPSDQAVSAAAGRGFAVALVDASAEAEDGRSVLRDLREHATLPVGQDAVSLGPLSLDEWGWHVRGDSRAVDNVVRRLRHKLGDQGRDRQLIVTVSGVGYRIGIP